MSDPIDDTTRAYARTLDAESVEAVLIDIRRLVGLYHEQHGQMERDDRDLLACHIDDLDRWLCAGAPLPPEWAAPVAEPIAPGAIGEALAAAGAGVERATTTLRAAEAARRRAVLTALDAGWSITKIAELAGLSRQGVYNIRSD